MNSENEYLKTLIDIESMLNLENVNKFNIILDELYKIKPVRLKWFILKARALKMLGQDFSDLKEIILKKYDLLYNNGTLVDILDCLIELTDNKIEEARYLYHKDLFIGNNENTFFQHRKDEYNLLIEKYLNDSISKLEFEKLIQNCYIRMDFEQCILYNIVYEKIYGTVIPIDKRTITLPNIELTVERLRNYNDKTYIVIEDIQNDFNSKAIIKALKFLGNNIFYIDNFLDVEIENKIEIEEILSITLDNAVLKDDCIVYRPVRLIYSNGNIENNIEYIVDYIDKNLANDNLAYVYSNGFIADILRSSETLKRSTERLSIFKSDYLDGNLTISRSGDYLTYISELYMCDVHTLIEQKEECDFSIVIPVSNNINTFKYTLQTCLNVRYQGSYEIVVSDNSLNGNTIVYDYIKSICDDRIKYYKTPRPFTLNKSFEFAFLHAKGEFIFSIGADDGVLPWSLDVLKNVIEKMKSHEIFLWDRGFYAWPGFNSGQQNQFIIPRYYQKNHVNVKTILSTDMLDNLFCEPQNMYSIPLLYINSGFRRSYFKTLLNKCGRMWDGDNQDINIGIINLAINYEIVKIDYPLTIAGMSSSSVGLISNKQLGYYSYTAPYLNSLIVTYEVKKNKFPLVGGDVMSLYHNIISAVSLGLLSNEVTKRIINNISNYEYQLRIINKQDELYEEFINCYIDCVENVSKELLKEFIEKFSKTLFLPIKSEKDNTLNCCRAYDIGFNEYGTLILDASNFDVSNIADAVELFEKITGM